VHNTLEDSLVGLKGKAISQALPDASFFNYSPTLGFSRARFGAYINSGLQVGLDSKMQGDDYFMYAFVSKNTIAERGSFMVMGVKNRRFAPELSLRGFPKEDFSALGFGLLRPVVNNYVANIPYPDSEKRIVSAFDAFNPDATGACIGTGSTTKPSWSAIRSRGVAGGLSGNKVEADIANANRNTIDEGRFIYIGSVNDRSGVLDGPPSSANRMVADIHFAAWATGANFNSADATLVGSKEAQFQEAVRVYLEARGVEGVMRV